MLDRIEAATTREAPVPLTSGIGTGGAQAITDWADPDYGNYLATSNDVYSVAWLRAKMQSKLPITVYGRSGTVQEPKPGNLAGLLDKPNPHFTRQRMMIQTVLSMAVWGSAAWIIERAGTDKRGRPRELWPVNPTHVELVPHRTDYLSHYIYRTPDGTEIPFRSDEMVWIMYPNPNDAYGPLVPMAAARLAADVASASMVSNRELFSQGMMLGGFVTPPDASTSFTESQAQELEQLMGRRFSGQGNAHRWQVLRYHLGLKPMNISPKDAEFIEGMNVTFRQVCRAMGVPPPLVGDAEFATLANLRVYERMFWEHTGSFESDFLAAEINRQLTPLFPAADRVAFDLSQVVALQEDEDSRWDRADGQITKGAITINEWRAVEGLEPVPWGDVWWAPATSTPVETATAPVPATGGSAGLLGADGQRVTGGRLLSRLRDYDEEEDGLASAFREVLRRQTDAVLQRLRQKTDDTTNERSAAGAARDPFDVIKWTERTRGAVASRYVAAAEKAMLLEGGALGLVEEELAALLEGNATRAALESQVQTFSKRVTDTTYKRLQEALSKGLRDGDDLASLTRRVEFVFEGRINNARQIAQTEVTRAVTTGQMAAFTQAGVTHKEWVTQGDELVRDSHANVNPRTVPVLDNFQVGAAAGPGPGRMGSVEEDVNCRCTLRPMVVKESQNPIPANPRSAANGEGSTPIDQLVATLEAI